jgi:hypothetical protein
MSDSDEGKKIRDTLIRAEQLLAELARATPAEAVKASGEARSNESVEARSIPS